VLFPLNLPRRRSGAAVRGWSGCGVEGASAPADFRGDRLADRQGASQPLHGSAPWEKDGPDPQGLRHGDFARRDDLIEKLEAYVIRHNETAKPYRWTYEGTPLKAT
ncbi:hypothetical protein ACGFYP_33500, partial [Streptomyces sp. NPDC048370]|uniref:hypothetical protein n=1 Tax=Streptomyces sp. NPDC048370 TaxID=3365540 RepID=UPI00371A2511